MMSFFRKGNRKSSIWVGMGIAGWDSCCRVFPSMLVRTVPPPRPIRCSEARRSPHGHGVLPAQRPTAATTGLGAGRTSRALVDCPWNLGVERPSSCPYAKIPGCVVGRELVLSASCLDGSKTNHICPIQISSNSHKCSKLASPTTIDRHPGHHSHQPSRRSQVAPTTMKPKEGPIPCSHMRPALRRCANAHGDQAPAVLKHIKAPKVS